MTVQQAKARIFGRLCGDYKKNSSNDFVDCEAIQKEEDIPLQIFHGALKDFQEEGNIGVELSLTPNIQLRLGPGGLRDCEANTPRYGREPQRD